MRNLNASGCRRRNEISAESQMPTSADTRSAYCDSAVSCVRKHPLYEKANELSAVVFDAVLEVRGHFGPGLMLEKVYQRCLARELEIRGHRVVMEAPVPIVYKGLEFDEKLRADLLVDDVLIVECKAVNPEKVDVGRFRAQALTYLRLLNLPLAMVVNFGAEQTGKRGISRVLLKGAAGVEEVTR